MERRHVLKAAGSVGLTGLLAGCSLFDPDADQTEDPPSRTVPSYPLDSEFDRVVDAVDDLGLDNSGGEAIDSTLLNSLEDGTLIEFPDGRYTISDTIIKEGVSNVGLVAAEGARPTLVSSKPTKDLLDEEYLISVSGSNILFGGFDMDFTRGSDYGGRLQFIAHSGDVTVFDVTTLGQLPGDIKAYRVEARAKSGVAMMDNVNIRDGAREGHQGTGLLVGPQHAGRIYIRDCEIWHFPSKGIYASNPAHPDVGAGGTIHVEGGLYKNNNDCDIRLGTAGSTVKNVVSVKQDTLQGETVTWEDPIPMRYGYHNDRTDIVQSRSIRLKHGEDVLIEGCEFVHEIGQGAGVITGEGSHGGGTTIRDCHITVNGAEIYPILLRDGDGGYAIENVSITGTGGRGAAIRVEDGHRGTVVRNCRINTKIGDGIEITPINSLTMTATDFTVPNTHIAIDDAARSSSKLPYTIEFEKPDDESGDISLLVTGDLQPVGTLPNMSLLTSTVGTQAIGSMDDATARFGFSGDVRWLSVDPSVVATVET